MRTIAVVNQKGGVGKTTTVCNVGAALARSGRRVLLVDLDAQAHLTFHLGVNNAEIEATSYDLMTSRLPIEQVIIERSDGLDVIPSHIDLAGAEIELVSAVARERILRDALATVADRYDYVLIDCPPSLAMMTLNALVAAEEILITLQPHFLALQGMTKLLETAALVRRRLNPSLRITGLVFCMFDGRTTLSTEVLADVENYFARASGETPLLKDVRVFETRIRRNIKLAEAPGFGQTIFEYEPTSHGAIDYAALAAELATDTAGSAASAGAEAAAEVSSEQPAPAQETAAAPATASAAEPAGPVSDSAPVEAAEADGRESEQAASTEPNATA